MIHPTIQSAVDDLGCTEIELGSETYFEDVTIERSLAVSGAGSASSRVAGQVHLSGATTVVTLADLTVNAADPSVAGCYREALDVEAGARISGLNIVVLNGTGDACLIFRDGFESGGTTAWSISTP